jgi:hypothetical protein
MFAGKNRSSEYRTMTVWFTLATAGTLGKMESATESKTNTLCALLSIWGFVEPGGLAR